MLIYNNLYYIEILLANSNITFGKKPIVFLHFLAISHQTLTYDDSISTL